MSIFSAGAADNLNSRLRSEGATARSTRRAPARPDGSTRADDEVVLSVDNTQTSGAVRSLKGNADEETRDDREQQDHYAPPQDPQKRPRLDLQA